MAIRMEKRQIPNISNEKAEQAIKDYGQERTKENLAKIVNLLRPSGLFVPAMLNEEQKPVPYFLKSAEGDQYLAVFTSRDQAPDEVKQKSVMIMPFTVCNSIVANEQFGLKGMVINPYTDNLILKTELISQLHEADKELAKKMKERRQNLTPEQYVQYMRNQIEFGVLPQRLYTEGESFVNSICDQKEDAVEELFRKGFKENSPYQKKQFGVMALTISETLLLIRIDMPSGQPISPYCVRVYITWNPKEQKAGYYTIEQLPGEKKLRLGCVDQEGKHTNLEEAPVEGAELTRIMELVGENI